MLAFLVDTTFLLIDSFVDAEMLFRSNLHEM